MLAAEWGKDSAEFRVFLKLKAKKRRARKIDCNGIIFMTGLAVFLIIFASAFWLFLDGLSGRACQWLPTSTHPGCRSSALWWCRDEPTLGHCRQDNPTAK